MKIPQAHIQTMPAAVMVRPETTASMEAVLIRVMAAHSRIRMAGITTTRDMAPLAASRAAVTTASITMAAHMALRRLAIRVLMAVHRTAATTAAFMAMGIPRRDIPQTPTQKNRNGKNVPENGRKKQPGPARTLV